MNIQSRNTGRYFIQSCEKGAWNCDGCLGQAQFGERGPRLSEKPVVRGLNPYCALCEEEDKGSIIHLHIHLDVMIGITQAVLTLGPESTKKITA